MQEIIVAANEAGQRLDKIAGEVFKRGTKELFI